ncbi:uncharacterized protein LOC129595372 [Paramacrobiotus metropolitanus]|uniref:uncharacterized protein LOC129595372 n=1 Tax=Paramacrobiotus metropolitanus TaxID=2943436 RepID=UPI002445C01B|nr:uncharacterized protein LOC129595372 [Paramacrobiotus metropolitanus]
MGSHVAPDYVKIAPDSCLNTCAPVRITVYKSQQHRKESAASAAAIPWLDSPPPRDPARNPANASCRCRCAPSLRLKSGPLKRELHMVKRNQRITQQVAAACSSSNMETAVTTFKFYNNPPQTELIRAPEGGTLLLPCNNTNRLVSHTKIPPAFTRNGICFPVNTPVATVADEKHFFCNCTNRSGNLTGLHWHTVRAGNYDRDSGAFTIELDNFTYAHSGLYECLHSNGSQLVVTKRYYVSATLVRHNVFQPPMQNVTVRHGDPAAMVCAVRFNFLPGKMSTRSLWRSEHHLMLAESIPEVAKKAKYWWGFVGSFGFGVDDEGRCSSTMTIDSVTWEVAGRYECWLRINDRFDEWIMQEAYLNVV